MRLDQMLGHHAAGDQMLLNNPFEHWGIALAVPHAFRVHDRNRTTLADAEAVGFGAKDAALFGELQLFETPLQKIPCGKATLLVAAFGFRLIAAQKDVAPRDRYTDAGRDFSLGIGHLVVCPSQIATGRSALTPPRSRRGDPGVVAPSRIAVEKMSWAVLHQLIRTIKYIQRVFRSLIIAACVLTASSALAQFGHPLKGSWSGDWGPNKDQRTRVLLQMQWDGKAITGAINPGPNALPLTAASLDPETWQVHLEARGGIVIDGKLENIGSAHRTLSGTWTQAGQKGDFRLLRN
jgi:hypothetical protein